MAAASVGLRITGGGEGGHSGFNQR